MCGFTPPHIIPTKKSGHTLTRHKSRFCIVVLRCHVTFSEGVFGRLVYLLIEKLFQGKDDNDNGDAGDDDRDNYDDTDYTHDEDSDGGDDGDIEDSNYDSDGDTDCLDDENGRQVRQ